MSSLLEASQRLKIDTGSSSLLKAAESLKTGKDAFIPGVSPLDPDSFENILDIAEDRTRAGINKSIGLVLDIFGMDETAAEYSADAKRIEKEAAAKPQPTISASITEEAPKIYEKFSEGEILSATEDSLQLAKGFGATILPSLGISTIGAVGALAAGAVGVPVALATGLGILVPSYLMSSGDIYEGAKEQGASEAKAKIAGVLGGGISAVIDRIGIGFWFNGIAKKLGRKEAIDSVANISGASKKVVKEAFDVAAESTTENAIKKSLKQFGKGALASTAGKEVTKELWKGTKRGALGEGLAETGQALTEILATNIAGDKPLSSVMSADSGKKLIDSLALGMAAGPIIGVAQGATAPIRKEAHRKAVEMEQLNDRLAKATTDYEQELILGERTALTEGRKFRTDLEEEQPGVDLGSQFAELGKLQQELNKIDKVKVKGRGKASAKSKQKHLREKFFDSDKGKRLNELKKELRFKKEGIGSLVKKAISRSTSTLESFANRTPVAREMINSLNNVIHNTNQRVGTFARQKTLILDNIRREYKLPFQKSINKKINNELYKELGTSESTTDSTIKKTASDIRKQILDPLYKALKAAGSELGYRENYLPVILKSVGIGKKGKKRRKRIVDILNENKIDGEAYLERAGDNEGRYRSDNSFAELIIDEKIEPEARTIGLELPRILPQKVVDQLAREGFLETDVEKLLNKYIVSASRNLEAKEFVNKYNPAILEFLDSGLMRQSEAKYLKKIVDSLENKYNVIKNKQLRKLYKFATTGAYIVTLGLAAIPSLVEPILVLTKVSPKNALWGLYKAAAVSGRKGVRSFKPKWKRSKDEEALMSLMQTSDMALNDSIRDIGDLVMSKKVTDTYFRTNLLAQVTQFSRNIAFQAGRLQIRDDIKTLERERATGDVTKDSINARKRFIELGLIKPVSRSKVKRETSIQQEISEWANSIERGGESVLAEPEIITKALGKLVNEVIMTPDILNRPLWMSNPYMAPLAQLKGFTMVFGNTIGMKFYKDIFLPMQKGRVPAADIAKNALTFTLLITAIMGTQGIKDAIRYGDEESPFDELKGFEKLWYAIKQSQIFGYGGIILDALDAEKYGSSIPEYLGGPQVTITSKLAKALWSGNPKRIARAFANLLPDLPYLPIKSTVKRGIETE